jgi:hypothetical protein
MILIKRISIIAVSVLLLSLPASSEDKGSGGSTNAEDIQRACDASWDLCSSTCKFKTGDSFSDQLSNILNECEDKCSAAHRRCEKSIALKKRKKGTTGVGEGQKGTYEQ